MAKKRLREYKKRDNQKNKNQKLKKLIKDNRKYKNEL